MRKKKKETKGRGRGKGADLAGTQVGRHGRRQDERDGACDQGELEGRGDEADSDGDGIDNGDGLGAREAMRQWPLRQGYTISSIPEKRPGTS